MKRKLIILLSIFTYVIITIPIFLFSTGCIIDMDKSPGIVNRRKRNYEYFSNDNNYVKLSGVVIEIGEMFIDERDGYSILDVKIQCNDIKEYYPDYKDEFYYEVCTSKMIDLFPGDEIEFIVAKYKKWYSLDNCPLVAEIEKEGEIILDISEGKDLLLKYVTDIHYK